MELRSAEQEMEEIRSIYESLRQNGDDKTKAVLRPLPITTTSDETTTNADASEDENDPIVQKSATELLQVLELLRERMDKLQDKIDKFRKRMNEKDPVTDKPRYGEKTLVRVQALVTLYDEMQKHIGYAFGEHPDQKEDGEKPIVHEIRSKAQIEQDEILRKEHEEQQRLEQQEAARRAEEEIMAQEQRQAEEAARLQREQEEAERLRQLLESQHAERRAREEADRRDREWVASINKGAEGVREQLKILVESTANDPGAQKAAITALHVIFSQIVAHPEEPSFRRIRRDHPRFQEDVGRHPGGKEILIAAGFRLGTIDDVPSYISTEPNLETDMDAWTQWFDLLKATREIVEEQLMK